MYSRKFEFEADNTGFSYMEKAGLNPKGMSSFFNKLLEEHGKDTGSGFMEILSTHPATADRIKNLKVKENELENKNYPKDTIDLKQFQNILKTKIKQ